MLENVCYIHSDDDWEPISPQNAIKRPPSEWSSLSHRFICETCRQYVALVNPRKGKPHFKHPVGSKECEEKIIHTTIDDQHKLSQEYALPLRLEISRDRLEIQIGFLPLPLALIENAIEKNARVVICDPSSLLIKEYAISFDRFSSEATTFLSVGENISIHYLLKTSQMGIACWPRKVEGVNLRGTLFNVQTGRRLQSQASVALNKSYWLLSKIMVFEQDGVSVNYIKTYDHWNLFEVTATRYSVDAIEFFSKFDVVLCEADLELVQLWPPAKRSLNVIRHCSEKLWFYKSRGHAVIHPTTEQISDEPRLICIEKTQEQQVLSISQNKKSRTVQQYVYICFVAKSIFDTQQHAQTVEVTDVYGDTILYGEHSLLPYNSELKIQTMFDGFVQIVRDGFVIDQMLIKANEQKRIIVQYNCVFRFYQGLDCQGEIVFSRPNKLLNRVYDQELLARVKCCTGNLIVAKHSLGSMANHMKSFPKTRLWLLRCLRSGVISSDAVNILRDRLRGVTYV